MNGVEALGREGTPEEYSQVLLDAVRDQVEKTGVDLFFAVAQDALMTAEVVHEIRKLGIPTVHLSCDDLSHPFRIEKIAGAFDINWSTVRESKARIESYGANVMVMPWGTNPHFFKPEQVSEDRVISFMGTTYGARGRHVADLALADLPVRVYGQSAEQMYRSISRVNNPLMRAFARFGETWQRTAKGLSFPEGRRILAAVLKRSFQEMLKAPSEKTVDQKRIDYQPSVPFDAVGRTFSRTALSLGSMELSSTYVLKDPILFIRLREFEVPMCGGVHLVNRFPEMNEYFEEDREMLYFGSTEELIDKTRFWLDPARDTARTKLREAARKRAVGEHTWLHRFRALGDELGIAI